MGDVAAHGDDADGRGFAPVGWAAGNGAGEAEEGVAVRELGDLDAGGAGGGEGGVNNPARAGAAEAHEGEAGRGEALGDVAGGVHAQEEEGNAAGIGALQGGETVAGLLVGDAEAGGDGIHVVADFLGGGESGVVGHEDRAGDVVEQSDAQEFAGVLRGGGGFCDEGFHRVAAFEEGDLEGHLEAAGFAGQGFGEREEAGFGVVMAQRAWEGLDGDDKAVLLAEALGEGMIGADDGGVQGGGDGFGGVFQGGEMVGVVVEEVSDFFVGEHDFAAGGEGDAGGILAGPGPGAVQSEDGAGGVGGGTGEFLDFGFGNRVCAQKGVREDFAQGDFELAFLVAGEGGEVDLQDVGEFKQEGGGDAALVVLDEVEVTG